MRCVAKTVRPLAAASSARGCSFVGAMYRGKIAPKELFPFPTTELPSHVREAMVDARKTLLTNVSSEPGASPNTDVYGMISPEDLGGLELQHPCVFDVLSQSPPQVYAPVHEHAFLATFLIRTFASKEHKGRYLSCMSDGSTQVAWAVAETSAANDFADVRATASFEEASQTLSLSGTKVVHHASPTAFLVLATVVGAPKSGLAVIWVDANTPGVSFKPGSVTFDKVKVPVDSVVVPGGEAYSAVMTTMLTGSYALAAARVSAARTGSTNVAETAATYALEALGSAVSANIERGVPDTFLESIATAAFPGLLRSLSTTPNAHAAGATLNRNTFSQSTLVKAQSTCGLEDAAVAFNKTSTLDTLQTRTLAMVGLIDHLPELIFNGPERLRFGTIVNKFGEVVRSVAVRFGTTSVEKELLLERLAAISNLLYATAAVMSRAHRAVSGKVPTAEVERALALYWTNLALDICESRINEIQHPTRTADDAHARLSGELLAQS